MRHWSKQARQRGHNATKRLDMPAPPPPPPIVRGGPERLPLSRPWPTTHTALAAELRAWVASARKEDA
jgi:hypothetical protein